MTSSSRRPTVTLLVNPAAGHGRARRRVPDVVARFSQALAETDVVVRLTTDYADARAQACEAVERAEAGDALVVMGGDGMASIGYNAAANSGVPLGIIPAGTGNDFCRGVGLPTKWRDALDVIVAGNVRDIDLMSVDGALTGGDARRWVGSILSSGFDEKVNWRANHMPVNFGAPTYASALFAELRTFRPLRYRLVIDGVHRELDAILVAVGNAGVFGGGIRICPDARVDDGILDITIVHPVSAGLVFKLFPALFSGRFTEHPGVEVLTAREVRVDGDDLFGMADGEDLGRPPFTCRAVGGALRLFAPAAL